MRTRKERAAYIAQKLDELYPEIPIPLDHTDAYTLLIAVLLSAQCTDARVNLVTPGLFPRLIIRRIWRSFLLQRLRIVLPPVVWPTVKRRIFTDYLKC